jgi:DNA polymerase III delta prime subunit
MSNKNEDNIESDKLSYQNQTNFSEDYIPLSEKNIPKTFLECIHSPKTTSILKSLITTDVYDGLPNIILYGKEGCGKYTRLMVLLNNYLGDLCNPYKGVVRAIDVETGSFVQLPNSKNKVKNKVIFAITSKSHCEIELGQANCNKALIPFLEYYSNSKNINLNIQKYVILRNVEFLKKETQNALRRIVEISHSKIRFMMTINSLSKFAAPLQSRFLCISVSSPSIEESTQIIKSVCTTNNLKISPKKIEAIIEKSYYGSAGTINLRELFLTLEGSFILSANKNESSKQCTLTVSRVREASDTLFCEAKRSEASDTLFCEAKRSEASDEAKSLLSVSKIYTSERNEASDLLIKEVKKGNREEIRNVICKIYEIMKDDFSLIITGDFYRKILNIIENEKLKTDFIFLTSYWNAELNKNHISQPIFQAVAYIYAVCDLLKF